MKNIKIGNINFEVHKSKYANVDTLSRYAGRTIYECYETPSKTKKYIYNEWLKWASDNNIQYFGVSGYSGFTFSLQGLTEIENTLYLLAITKSANKAYIIE